MRSEVPQELPPRSSNDESWELQFEPAPDEKESERGGAHDQPE